MKLPRANFLCSAFRARSGRGCVTSPTVFSAIAAVLLDFSIPSIRWQNGRRSLYHVDTYVSHIRHDQTNTDGERMFRKPQRLKPLRRFEELFDGTSRRNALSSLAFAFALVPLPSGAAVDLLSEGLAGRWRLTETRAGNECIAELTLTPKEEQNSSSLQTLLGTQRGYAQFSAPCVDPARGTWTAQDGKRTGPRLAARLEYEKSSVFYSLSLDRSKDGDGSLIGKGEIYAAPRSNPNALRRVGTCFAQKVGL